MAAKIKNRFASSMSAHKTRPRGVSRRAFERVYLPYLPLLVIGASLLVIAAQPRPTDRLLHPTHAVLSYATSARPENLLADTNRLRQANNLPALSLNSQLTAAATAKARDMAARNYWSHQTPDGQPPWLFVAEQGYNYQSLAENLATGFDNEATVVSAWQASGSHRANMLNAAYREVGFGSANDANFKAIGGGPMTIVVAYYAEPVGPAGSAAQASSVVKGAQTSARTSRAQVDLAALPFARLATWLVGALLLVVVGFWLGRHFRLVRRLYTRSERAVRHHPLIDLGFLVVVVALIMWLQTAGYTH